MNLTLDAWVFSFLQEHASSLAVLKANDRLSQAARYLIDRKVRDHPPPLSCRLTVFGDEPLWHLCQLALLWQYAGYSEKAMQLAGLIAPFLSFPTLFCPEVFYTPEKISKAIALFEEQWPSFPSKHPLEGVHWIRQELFEVIWTPLGKKSPLGILKASKTNIPAFGPQIAPLSCAENFGITGMIADARWMRVAGCEETWLHVDMIPSSESLLLKIRYIGLQDTKKNYFCFYVQASRASILDVLYYERNLKRYEGEPQKVTFDNFLTIEASDATRMHLIPLSGEKNFWQSQFLIAYEINFFSASSVFNISFNL